MSSFSMQRHVAILGGEQGVGRIIEAQDRSFRRQLRRVPTRRHDDRHLRVRQHERDSIDGIRQVQGQIGAAGLEHPENRDDEVERPIERDPHQYLRPHSACHQAPRELIGAAVQLAVGQMFASARDGDAVRGRARLVDKQLCDALLARIRRRRGIRCSEQGSVGRRQDGQAVEARLRGSHSGLQQALIAVEQPVRSGLVEQVDVVLQFESQAARLVARIQKQVALGRAVVAPEQGDPQPAERLGLGRGALQRHHDLQQRQPALVTTTPHEGMDTVERHRLVRLCRQRRGLDRGKQVTKRGVAFETRPDEDGVDEVPDQRFEFVSGPAGDWRRNQQIPLLGVAMQQRSEARDENHEERRALNPAQAAERGPQSRRCTPLAEPSPSGHDRSSRTVGRQRHPGRRISQLLPPVVEARLAIGTNQLVALPLGEIRKLHLERRKLDGATRGRPVVAGAQLFDQDADGPPIEDRVMQHQRQRMLARAQLVQRRAE